MGKDKTIELKAKYALGGKVFLCRVTHSSPKEVKVKGPFDIRDIAVSVKTGACLYQLEMRTPHLTIDDVFECELCAVGELNEVLPELLGKAPSKPVKIKCKTSYEDDDEGKGYFEEDE